MTKLGKLLLCICMSFIALCSIVSNTFCGVDDAPTNLYNISLNQDINFDYIKNSFVTPDIYNLYTYQNFKLNIFKIYDGRSLFDLYFEEYPEWVDNCISNWGGILQERYHPISGVTNFCYDIEWKIVKFLVNGSVLGLAVNINSIKLVDNSYSFTINPSTTERTIGFQTGFLPFFIKDSGAYGLRLCVKFVITFDLVCESPYFTNSFNMIFNQTSYVKSSYLSVAFKNSDNMNFIKNFSVDESQAFKKNTGVGNILLNNFYDGYRTNIESISIGETFDLLYYNIDEIFSSSFYMLSHVVADKSVYPTMFRYYFSQFNVEDNSKMDNSSLIPIGSNQFYKNCAWYDIPSQLYNLFIYLIFDAPIISNFTKLAMVIINFLVETFQFVIGLFNGVSNVFFISIFVGMLALIFLLKIIFGGKT